MAPDHHVGGIRRQRRARRRLEEAVARRVPVGTDQVEQLGARLPVRIGVHGHRHRRRPVRYLGVAVRVVGALDVDADAPQQEPQRVEPVVKPCDTTLLLVESTEWWPLSAWSKFDTTAVSGSPRTAICGMSQSTSTWPVKVTSGALGWPYSGVVSSSRGCDNRCGPM